MPFHVADRDTLFSLGRDTTDSRFARAIEDIDLGLRLDDPRFARRMRRRNGAGLAKPSIIVPLLVASAALLAIGLAANSLIAFTAGALALVTASAIDDPGGAERAARRQPAGGPPASPVSGPSSVARTQPTGHASSPEVVR